MGFCYYSDCCVDICRALVYNQCNQRVVWNQYSHHHLDLAFSLVVVLVTYIFGEEVIVHTIQDGTHTVTIGMQRYTDLLRSEKILEHLYAGGVDNWEWYDVSMEPFWDSEED